LGIDSNNKKLIFAKKSALQELGRKLFAEKRYKEAAECYEKILKQKPEDKEAKRNKALAFNGQGEILL